MPTRIVRFFFLLPLLVAGCGDGKTIVTGTVSLDGVPVESGSITFVKAEGDVREGAVIANGAFRATVPPGKYKLELTGTKVTGTRTQAGFDGKPETVELRSEIFPPRYNTNSELSEAIKPGGPPLKLDLKSK